MTKKETKQERDEVKIQFLISILSSMGQEVISRREPEFMFTAAYIAAAGAVAWGVAAIDVSGTVYFLLNPAIVGAIGVVLIGLFVMPLISWAIGVALWLCYILLIVIYVAGIINSLSGSEKPLLIIGKYAEKIKL